ncbi:MAG TPA: hypothetical protein VK766_00560 [Cytophagaceae bacterium]|jgi:hypothetical protein|nr:hypothetical protein [Cytophagaceae bacterium]HSZ87076.1 hypothetical protein [Puia sp.]
MKKIAKEIFTWEKMIDFLLGEILGRFVGFIVGMWSTSMFSKVVYEKKGIKNLFGLAGRKKIVVNTTPEWLQFTISIIVGFIMLELVSYFFKNKYYLSIWLFIQKHSSPIFNKKSTDLSKDEVNN